MRSDLNPQPDYAPGDGGYINAASGGYSSPLPADTSTFVQKTYTLTTTAPLTGGGDLTANRTLAMAAATDSVSGYLTSSDHTTFAAKVTFPGFGVTGSTACAGNDARLGGTTTAVASATLTAGQWVSFHNVAGVKNVRPADSTDATKPVHGFVLAGFSTSATATVYLEGTNTAVALGAYVAADAGKPVFLGTAGATTLTPPTTTGNLLQQVGWVDAVSSTVTVTLINSPGIIRA